MWCIGLTPAEIVKMKGEAVMKKIMVRESECLKRYQMEKTRLEKDTQVQNAKPSEFDDSFIESEVEECKSAIEGN
jgi:hypothetical protein